MTTPNMLEFEDVTVGISEDPCGDETNNNNTNISIPCSDQIDDSNNPKDEEDKLGFVKRKGHQNKSKSQKRSRNNNGFSEDDDFEKCVKVIKRLECEGHMEKSFKHKFVNWLKLKARPHEVKVVKVYINTFHEDPASLVEQLVDTFSECLSCKTKRLVPAELCMKLWH